MHSNMAVLWFLVAIALSSAPAGADAPRVFPDTRARIAVFADQLPNQITDAQRRFIATHYVGSQKQTRAWTRRVRALNPGYLMLHYQLAVGAGPALFVDGDQWVNDFDAVARHEDWFVHNPQGNRVLQTAWNWYVMDVRVSDGRPRTGFPDYWVQTALQRMRDNEADGCFADSYTQDILMNQVQPPTPLFSSVQENLRDWLPGLNDYGAYVTAAFHRQPEQFRFLPNLGGMVTTWDRVTDLAVGDGGMNEGFCAGGPGNYYSDDDWKLQMSRLLSLASKGKIVLCQTAVDPAALDHRWFLVGAFLLTKGPHSYLNMFQKSTLEWYPEYTLDLGAYRDAPQSDLQAYWRPDWNCYARSYEKGMVLVNPSAAPVTVHLGAQSWHVVSAQGGGAVGEDGSAPGTLTTRPVMEVTVPPHSARVLLRTP
jgi:hypothetical protein